MPVTDPIADALTRVRNAVRCKRDQVHLNSSKIVIALMEALRDEGYIASFDVAPGRRTKVQNELVVRLKYGANGEPAITKIDRVSKPGCRVYQGKSEFKPVLRGLGIIVLTTPKGVLSDRRAREANVGGEVLCRVE